MTTMQFQIQGGVSIEFSDKPADNVRAALKRMGFRWSPAARQWWRRRVTGAADDLAAIQRLLSPESRKYPCWRCKQPGELRNYGAAAPVLCEVCHLAHEGNDRVRYFDLRAGWMFGRIVRCDERDDVAVAWVEFDALPDKSYRPGFPSHCRRIPRLQLETVK
jgi:hypothetical protein